VPILFYRNTHQAPEFRDLRVELENSTALHNHIVHFLTHQQGKTLPEILAGVAEYNRQFPYDGTTTPEEAILDLAEGLQNASIRMEEVPE